MTFGHLWYVEYQTISCSSLIAHCPRISAPSLEFRSGAAQFVRTYSTFCSTTVMVTMRPASSWCQVVTAPFMPALCRPGSHVLFLPRCITATGIDFLVRSWKWSSWRRSIDPILPARMHSRLNPVKVRDVVGDLLYSICSGDGREQLLAVRHRWGTILGFFIFPCYPCSHSCNALTVRDNYLCHVLFRAYQSLYFMSSLKLTSGDTPIFRDWISRILADLARSSCPTEGEQDPRCQ